MLQRTFSPKAEVKSAFLYFQKSCHSCGKIKTTPLKTLAKNVAPLSAINKLVGRPK
jgi:hypothetical protein